MKNVFKIITFLIILIILLNIIGEIFYGKSEHYMWASMDLLYDLPKNSVEVAVFGSSITKHGFLPLELYKNTRLENS